MKPPDGNILMHGMDFELYGSIEALSQSGAKKLLRSPAHYLFEREHPKPSTEQMQFGTAVHCGVLEPDELAKRVCVLPEVNRRTTVGKAAIAEFERQNPGRLLFDAETYARIQACVAAVRAHPAAKQLLDGADAELSCFWVDGKYKVPCKARFDARNHGGLIDLKTCTDASPEAFARSIAVFNYHLQASWYYSGAEHVLNETPAFFVLIAVESEPPHGVACYSLPGNAILAGAHLMDRALERYAAAKASGNYPCYPETIETIQLPRWATMFNY